MLVDGLLAGVGAAVRQAIWRPEFPLFLRSRQPTPWHRALERKPVAFLLASGLSSAVPDPLRYRSAGRVSLRRASYRRHRVHVRSGDSSSGSIARPLPPGCASFASVGAGAFGIRREGMEIPDAYRMDGGADQLFLASSVQRQLGARVWA